MNAIKKKVSIIVAAYNVDNYIERCIMSLINQTMNDIEIIIVNDGSTDLTESIIEKFKFDERIIIINKKNEGLIEARKTGLSLANGKYVLFVDGDDWLNIETCKKLYEKAESEKVDIVYFKLVVVKENKKINVEFDNFGKINKNEYLKLILQDKIRANIVLQFIHRDFIQKNNIKFPSDISYAEDLALTISLAVKSPNVSFLNESLYYYFQRSDSLTNEITTKVFEVEKAINYVEELLRDEKLHEKYCEQLEYLKFVHLFYYRIITAKKLTKIHKKLYEIWNEKAVVIQKNKYYLDMIKGLTLENKIKIKMFSNKYFIGYIYVNTKYYFIYFPYRLIKKFKRIKRGL